MLKAAGVLIRRGGRWLLLRNAREGHWGFAKGHLADGEDELAGALREVKEETGLVPRLDPVFREAIRYTVPSGKKKTHEKEVVYYLGSVAPREDVARSEEHDRAEWLSLEDALARIEHSQLQDVLKRAARFAARGR